MKIAIIGLVVILILVGGAYFVFWGSKQPTSQDPNNPSGGAAAEIINTPYGQQVALEIAEFDKIRKISLNFTIFDDTLFKALHPAGSESSTTPQKSRANPFVPF